MAKSYTQEYLKEIATKLAKNSAVEDLWSDVSPDTNEPHVGIEIELYTFFPHLLRMFANSDIAKYISIAEDHSIEINEDDEAPDNWVHKDSFIYEVQICAPERIIREVVGKTCSILRYAKCVTNSTCGLHIHLDHRDVLNRNPVNTFNNLIKMQDVLFDMTDNCRQANQYCEFIDDDTNFYQHIFDQYETGDDEPCRYYAINLLSLRNKNTIEVRIFAGTTKVREINHYLNMVLGAVQNKPIKEKVTIRKLDIVKKIPKSTKNYILRKAA